MYKLKNVAKRGSALLGAVSLLAGISTSALPAFASADALNPLTDRSLSLSSSSPGWSFLDGSGNTTYAPPNSGANGQKTGNFFSFKTSTNNADIKAFTFQYCTVAAGDCIAPGDNAYVTGTPDTRGADTASTSDLKVVTSSPSEITDWSTIEARQSGVTPGEYAKTPLADNSEGNFIVLVNGTQDTGWTMTAGNNETGTVAAHTATGKNNIITLTKSGGTTIPGDASIEIKFFATNTNYITNPGSGAFFVKINDYSDDTDVDPITSTHIVDGGVTVANVMNQSISIQTKVLETMDFSVGTFDPDTYPMATLTAADPTFTVRGQCDAIWTKDPTSATFSTDPENVIKLGQQSGEFSLATGRAYDGVSYWRLSSNSSGGATVYYTGHTLTNTEGDEITPLTDGGGDHGLGAGLGTASAPGTEQFGLGIDQTSGNNGHGSTVNLAGGDTWGNSGTAGTFANYVSGNPKAHLPNLNPLVSEPDYGNAFGDDTSTPVQPSATTGFAFNSNADASAVPIASESTDVVDCVTAKMRYVANTAATTPAGIYTTKVNYVASPQY